MPAPPLKSLSGEQLQAARKAAVQRFEAVAMKYVPEGYTLAYRKSLSGRCRYRRKLLEAPRPVTRKALYIFLHECAHAHLGHGNGRVPRHVREFEAERWAHEKMRESGIPVPRSMTLRAKQYVARKIRQAKSHGAKKIDHKAAEFAGVSVRDSDARNWNRAVELDLEAARLAGAHRAEREEQEITMASVTGEQVAAMGRQWLRSEFEKFLPDLKYLADGALEEGLLEELRRWIDEALSATPFDVED